MNTRRDVLRSVAAAAAAMVAGKAEALAGEASERRVVAGFLEDGLRPGLGLWTRHAVPDARIDLPARVHAVTLAPDGTRCVAVARRPGRFGVVADLDRFERSESFEASADRHFFGHGSFVDDGRLFLTTENDVEGGRGMIGLRDARQGFRMIGEWPSGGIGPHDLALGSDGRHLYVANGGIDMSPTSGRAKLNEGAIVSSIAAIELSSGTISDLIMLGEENASLSIRHLAPLARGHLAFGCEETERDGFARPLVGLVGDDRRPRFFDEPSCGWARLQRAIGEVTADETGGIVAATAPRGGLCMVWEAITGRCLATVSIADCCGIGAASEGFVVTSGRGAMLSVGEARSGPILTARQGFDNHLATA